VVIDEETIVVTVPSSSPVVLSIPTDDPISVSVVDADPVVLNVPSEDPVVINVATQGPPGPPGADADLVCAVKPDSTLTYTGTLLTRVDYADGRYKELTYTLGQLTQVDCVDPGVPSTIRKTLGYTGNQLTSVSSVEL
jgi:hypothetical protein